MADIIKNIITRIDSSANWSTLNPVPANGEQCIEVLGKGLFKLKVGDGVTPWIALKYATLTSEDPRIGDLKELITKDKSKIVYAINSVQSEVNLNTEDIARIKEILEDVVPQYEELPEASESTFGVVAQYIGPTTEDYTHGLFYEVVEVSHPEHIDFEATVEDLEQVEFNQETFLENLHPEDHAVWMLTYNVFDEQGDWYYNGQIVDPAYYGITVGGEVEQGNTLRIEYFPEEENTYGWEKVDTTNISEKVDKTHEELKIYGTDKDGNQKLYDKEDFGKVDDVQLNGVSVVENKIANLEPEADDIAYTNEQYPEMQTLQDAMDKLLYITPVITKFSINAPTELEVGATKSTTTLSWTWNKAIKTQSLNQGIGSLETNVRSYTYNTPITSNTTFRLTGSDGTTEVYKDASVAFKKYYYYGISLSETLSDADIRALASSRTGGRTWASSNQTLSAREFNCTPTEAGTPGAEGYYAYFVVPTEYAKNSYKVTVNGQPNSGYLKTTKADYTNEYGIVIPMTIFRFMKDNKLTTTYTIGVL